MSKKDEKKIKHAEFIDFNKFFTLDEHVKYLEAYFKFDSSGVAKSVHELIKSHKKNSVVCAFKNLTDEERLSIMSKYDKNTGIPIKNLK